MNSSQAETRLTVQVRPGAKQNQVTGFVEDILQVRVAAPPREGKANTELIEFLSQLLSVSKSSITIERGLTGKRKVLTIKGLDHDQIAQRLAQQPLSAI